MNKKEVESIFNKKYLPAMKERKMSWSQEEIDELQEDLENFVERYEHLKSLICSLDPEWYEQWKAGGYLVDSDILSMYPNIYDILEKLEDGKYEPNEESD